MKGLRNKLKAAAPAVVVGALFQSQSTPPQSTPPFGPSQASTPPPPSYSSSPPPPPPPPPLSLAASSAPQPQPQPHSQWHASASPPPAPRRAGVVDSSGGGGGGGGGSGGGTGEDYGGENGDGCCTILTMQPLMEPRGDAKQNSAAISNPNPKSVTLSQVLRNPVYKEAYSLYLETKKCSEVMDFYDAVELLKSTAHLFNSESPDADLSTSPAWCGTSDSWKEMVMDIYTHFVCEDSPQQINIPGTVLMEITSQVNSNNFPVDIYDSAQEEMKKMMQSDSFQQFLVTPTLKVLLSTQPLIVDTEPEISDTTIVPVCPKCLTEVTAGSKTCIVKDSLWHAGCISCIHCDTPLPADDYTQKFPRCSTCDGFNYKVSALQANNKRVLQDLTPSCLACDQLIEDENYIVRRIGEKLEERFFWHNECFICSACGPSGSQLALPYPFDHAIQIKFCLSEMSMFCKEHLSGSVTPFLTPKKIRPEIFQMRPALCTPTLPVQLIPEMMPQISRSQRPCLSEIVLYNNCIHPEPPPRTPPPKPTLTPCVICPPMLTQKDTPVPVCSCILGEATCPCGPMDHLSKKTEPEKPMDLQRLRSFSVISTRVTPTAVQCLRQTRRAIASSTRPPLGTPTPPVLLELSIIILTQSPVRPCLSSPALPECLQVLKPQFPQTRSPRPPLDPPTSPSEISPVAPPCIHTRCRKPQLSCPTAPCHSLLGPPSDQVVDALSENPPAEGPPKISSEQVPPPESTVLQGEFKPPVLCEEGSPGFDHISPPINDKDFSSGETIPIDAQLEVIQQLQQQQNELQKQRKRRSSLLNHLSDEQLKQEAVAQFHELRKQQEERQRLHHQLLKENRTRNRALKQQERMQSYLMELLTVMENSPESFTESLPDADLSLPETDLPLPAETELSPDMEYTSPIESPRELQSYDQMLQTALSLNPPPLPKTDTTPYEEQGTRNDSPPPCPSPVPPSLTPESAFIPPPPFPEDLCMACNTAITPATPHKLIPGRNMKVHSDCIVCHTCGSNTPSSFGITQGRFYCPGCYSRNNNNNRPLQDTNCFVCQKTIPGGSFAVNIDGRYCHTVCLCCSLCQVPFGDKTSSFTRLRDRFLCPSCHTKVISRIHSQQQKTTVIHGNL